MNFLIAYNEPRWCDLSELKRTITPVISQNIFSLAMVISYYETESARRARCYPSTRELAASKAGIDAGGREADEEEDEMRMKNLVPVLQHLLPEGKRIQTPVTLRSRRVSPARGSLESGDWSD